MTNQHATPNAESMAREPAQNTDLTADLFRKIDAYWRGANYLFLGQIYLFDNPLLKDL
jgi:phosphoketolase